MKRYYIFNIDPYEDPLMPQVWAVATQESNGDDIWQTLTESQYGFDSRGEAIEYALTLADFPITFDSLPHELR